MNEFIEPPWDWDEQEDSGYNYLAELEVILQNLDLTNDYISNIHEAILFSRKWSLEYERNRTTIANEER